MIRTEVVTRPHLKSKKETRSQKAMIKRALVGWTGSNADTGRLFTVMQWMSEHFPKETNSHRCRIIDTKFDLTYRSGPSPEYGSDFLADDRTFDLVILHHLFIGWDELESVDQRRPAIADMWWFNVSPLHSVEAWRKRLAATKAKRIFAFGGFTEVANLFLIKIPGYTKIITDFGAVFEREE